MLQIGKTQLLRHVRSENPWWEDAACDVGYIRGRSPRAYMRAFYPVMKNRKIRRAVVLMGPRRVGKTVMLHHAIRRLLDEGVQPRSICYMSVENPLYSGMGLEELRELYAEASGVDPTKEDCYLIVDEIQYMKQWEQYLKSGVDRFDRIKFVVSGSAAAALRLKSNESGAGRFTDFMLPPLNFYEYMLLTDQCPEMGEIFEHWCDGLEVEPIDVSQLNKSFVDYINFGGYPEVALSAEAQSNLRQYVGVDVIEKVLLRDLPSLYGISDVQELNRLFTTLVLNTGQEISLDELSKSASVAKNTIKRYIGYLEAAFLIRRLDRIDQHGRRFKRATRFKIYLTNPSMYTAMFGPVSQDDPSMGALVETAMYGQLGGFAGCYDYAYARWKSGEVDFVRMIAGNIDKVLECKWSDRAPSRPEEVAAALAFCRKNRVRELLVTTRTQITDWLCEKSGVTVAYTPAAICALVFGASDTHTRLSLGEQAFSPAHQEEMLQRHRGFQQTTS
jgi:predicted AAA+ superfamily ATPase